MAKYFLVYLFFLCCIGASFSQGNIRLSLEDAITDSMLSGAGVIISFDKLSADTFLLNEFGTIMIPKPAGKYSFKITCKGYKSVELNNISVSDSKTIYVVRHLIPSRKLTRKEKKKAGLHLK